ncbi:GspH/FimT family pseudopilin [Pseudomonas benzenivorans]|uniref:Type II secretion system protein H n=1 Tax=Pseudomonas benzenivorans TaxID=556533 RepID=A0ABZ0PVA8_9PSED|nr:GspH/FimT family pseudopilin [Pseudomonas benzenivorans]WPC04404.1 GspH/FimT family pseudopilin [Pseudomonas benzenivorans]
MQKDRGLGLIELLVVLAILAIVLGLAAPSLHAQIIDQQRTATLNQMLGALQHTRSTAVYSREITSICSGTASCQSSKVWSRNLLIFKDANRNGTLDAHEHIEIQEKLAEGYTWYWGSFRNRPYLSYEGDGTTLASNGTMTLCRNGIPLNQIVISLSGRVRHQAAPQGARCR